MADFLLEIAENERHLCVERGCVVIKHKHEVIKKIPTDTLSAVILSAHGCTVSKNFLATVAEHGIPVVTCGKNYLPISITLPTGTHYKSLPVVTAQMHASPILKKRLWQQIVIAKIHNQAQILQKSTKNTHVAHQISLLAKKVHSGDSDHKEAQAARLYWGALMGKNFIRDRNAQDINIFFNYGYTILRAACARALCGAGLLPLLGVQHHNTYNAFCLADDMMEPLRPFVDNLVMSCKTLRTAYDLEPKHKKILAEILRTPLPFGGEKHTLFSVTSRMAFGLVKAFMQKDATLLPLPYIPAELKQSMKNQRNTIID